MLDARVPSLGGNAAANSLSAHGLSFDALNRLNESGLIIADYNSWFDYRLAIGLEVNDGTTVRVPFVFQGKSWILAAKEGREAGQPFRLRGVALSTSGRELARIVELEPMGAFIEELKKYFAGDNLQMVEVSHAIDHASSDPSTP